MHTLIVAANTIDKFGGYMDQVMDILARHKRPIHDIKYQVIQDRHEDFYYSALVIYKGKKLR